MALVLIVTIAFAALAAGFAAAYRLRQIFAGAALATVDFSPHRLRPGEVAMLIAAVMSKTIRRKLGFRQQAPPELSLGSVNVKNRFEVILPESCDLSLLSVAGRASVRATVSHEPRIVKRGREYDLEVSILVKSDVSGGETLPVFRQIFTMLEFGKGTGEATRESRAAKVAEAAPVAEALSTFTFSSSDPWDWAALCRDYNFIHLSTAAARVFGMSGRVAHGNHVLGKAIQALLERQAVGFNGDQPIWFEARFRRPMAIPGMFTVGELLPGTGLGSFAIFSKGKKCIEADYGVLHSEERA
ncbi:ricin B lectin [Colletotrichum tofieldiae]|uniref:Ricin B lectin n=1 Tax=Colletotrichum tofieldiae TaxID=708197 RepID=A0A166MK43_9PEZI|nr:ricin B lectin [Colletotrichum tofieldiae]